MDKRAFLKTNDLLSEVPEPLLLEIGKTMEEITEKKGAVIFREGDVGDHSSSMEKWRGAFSNCSPGSFVKT